MELDADAKASLWDERLPILRTGDRDPISPLVRQLVYKRDGWMCVRCSASHRAANPLRRPDVLNIDHVIPWSFGGSDRSDNLRTFCRSCNEARGNRRWDMDTYHPMPIAGICEPCLPRPMAYKPTDAIEVYCACRHHLSWVPDWSRVI